MKVGGITIHWAHNFGAMLQAYALQHMVEKLGHKYTIINYVTNHQRTHLKLFVASHAQTQNVLLRVRRYMRGCYNLLHYMQWKRRSSLFEDFRTNYLKTTNKNLSSFEELIDNCPKFDAYMCGSDQIWRVGSSSPWFDASYYLGFVRDSSAKKIAYAPSFGADFVDDKYREKYTKYLNEIHYLSVRERHGQEIIRNLTGREVPVVLDPVLLVSRTHWDAILKPPEFGEPYILVYYVGGNFNELMRAAHHLKKRTGVRRIVSLYSCPYHKRIGVDHIPEAGPLEFIGWIKNASYICTSSFHGMAYSTIFERPFYAVMPGKISSRLESLGQILDLRSRFIVSPTQDISEIPIDLDYSRARNHLTIEKDKSVSFLRESLSAADNACA